MGYLGAWGIMRPEGAKFATIQDGVVSGFGLDEATKRVLDVVAATMGLTLFAPILLIISIAVKLGSRGPIFIQTKYRYDNRAMKVLKFRVVARTSPRVAQLGQILNQTGIDELPQLFDVLRGESLARVLILVLDLSPWSRSPTLPETKFLRAETKSSNAAVRQARFGISVA
jgi:hypothetical protein